VPAPSDREHDVSTLFDMRDFAPEKPAYAEGCLYCYANDDGLYPDQAFHEREHLPRTCSVCGEESPNRLLFEMNHGGPSWIAPVKCTSLYLRLNHLTYAVLHGLAPEARDLTVLDLGWRIAPDGAQLPPADWDELHPPAGAFPDQVSSSERESRG